MSENLSHIPPSVSCNPETADHNIILTVDVAGHISGDLTLPEPQAEPVTRHPSYCTQNNGDCSNCPLMVDGYDCQDNLDLLDLLEEPDHPEYCTQNGGDCSTCSLVNYGLDCMNNRVSDREVNP
jgi:hypothetical protein